MPSTAPTLTWQMTALRTPVDAADCQSVLDTLALCVGDLALWEVKASAAGYIEIGPVAGSATPLIRIIIAFGVDAAQITAPHNSTAGVLYYGIAPDGGTIGLPLSAAGPYVGNRWSGYWKTSGIITGLMPADRVFCVASDEIVSFWFQELSPDDWYGGIGGCILDPPTDADGERFGGSGPGRLYGLMTSGGDIIASNFWSNVNYFTSSGGGNNDPQVGVFDPVATTTFRGCDRFSLTAAGSPRMETAGGTVVSMPFGVYYQSAITNFVGIYRQMRYTSDSMMRTVIQNSSAVDKAFYISGATATNGDVLSFDNG